MIMITVCYTVDAYNAASQALRTTRQAHDLSVENVEEAMENFQAEVR